MGERPDLAGLDKHLSQFICKVCNRRFPVPILARDCERAHTGDVTVAS